MDIRKLTDRLSVSPQILVEDVAKIKAAGFKTIVNNRPDGEEVSQPLNADIKTAVEDAGLAFHFIPVTSAPFDPKFLVEIQRILDNGPGPILFYCRTGTRCTNLWAISQKGKVPGSQLIETALDAGYNISGLAEELG